MRTEYKRDMNHNYLIVYGENEINTDSYQVRMLAGNVIPSPEAVKEEDESPLIPEILFLVCIRLSVVEMGLKSNT